MKEFRFRIWRFVFHNMEQWDLKRFPLLCVGYEIPGYYKRLFCI